MLTASGFAWSVLSQNHAFAATTEISAIGFIIFYLVISLLPLCCKVTMEERDLPLHEHMGNGRTDSSPPADSSSSSLFKKPPGILRSTRYHTVGTVVLKLQESHIQDPWIEPSLPDKLVRICFHSCNRLPSLAFHVLLRPGGQVDLITLFTFPNYLRLVFYFSIFCYRPKTRLWPLAVIGGALWVPGPQKMKIGVL